MIPDMLMDSHCLRQPVRIALALLCAASMVGCGSKASSSAASDPFAEPITLDTLRVLGESGTQRGQFVYPRAMDVFSQNKHPYAAFIDKTARIQIIDLESGSTIGSVHTPRWDRGKPTGISVATSAIDHTQLAVYIADTHEHRVLMYQLPLPNVEIPVPTQPDIMFGSFGEDPGQFIYPTDVAIQTDDAGIVTHLYVSEYGGNDRISRFTIERTESGINPHFEYQIGTASEEVDASDGPVALSRPQSIELWTNPEGDRELIVTDASHHRVGRLTTAGDLIAWYGTPLDHSPSAYRFPYGITVLDDGSALITEFGANRVRCINLATGDTLWRYGVGGRSEGQIVQPWDSGVIGDKLVVLDSGNNRVQICKLPPGISKIGNESSFGLNKPRSSGGNP